MEVQAQGLGLLSHIDQRDADGVDRLRDRLRAGRRGAVTVDDAGDLEIGAHSQHSVRERGRIRQRQPGRLDPFFPFLGAGGSLIRSA